LGGKNSLQRGKQSLLPGNPEDLQRKEYPHYDANDTGTGADDPTAFKVGSVPRMGHFSRPIDKNYIKVLIYLTL
jgi:hypothetical protein